MGEKLSAKIVGVYLNDGTEITPVWKLVTCTSSDGFNMSTSVVDASTKCDGQWEAPEPGKNSWGFDINGLANITPSGSEISHNDLVVIAANQEVKQWKITDNDDYTRMGYAFITDYSEEAPDGEYVSFSATLNGRGAVSFS